MKHTGMDMHSADACGRNDGDDVCSAQAEAVQNCQTSLPSTRELDFFFFQKLQTQPNLYTFSSKKIKERFLCVFVRQDMIPVTCRTPSVNQALNTFFLVF